MDLSKQAEPILRIEGLTKHFALRRKNLRPGPATLLKAVDGVDLELFRNETLGLVGESGCGKSTLAMTLLRLEEPTGGRVTFRDEDLTTASAKRMRELRRSIQIVFQDPYASLNGRLTIEQIVAEPLDVHGLSGTRSDRRRRVAEMLERVGLKADDAARFPHQFSGGQRQRIGIARALILRPEVVVCDEPVSALDVSVQAQVLNLLAGIREEMGLSLIFISHDLSVVRHICDRVAVMYLGRVVESGTAEQIHDHPVHPYTQALVSAAPRIDDENHEPIVLEGDVPSPTSPPSGCTFRTRCWRADELCADIRPELRPLYGRDVACHHPRSPE